MMNRWPAGAAIRKPKSSSGSNLDKVSLYQLNLSFLLRANHDQLAFAFDINSGKKQFLACIRGEWVQGTFIETERISLAHVILNKQNGIVFSPSGHKFKKRNGWEGLWEILKNDNN